MDTHRLSQIDTLQRSAVHHESERVHRDPAHRWLREHIAQAVKG